MFDETTITETSEHPARSEFADLIDAFRDYFHGDEAQWRIGALLNEYCGPPGANGRHNGATEKMKRVMAALVEVFGDRAEFCSSYIERWRTIEHRFPPDKRLGGLGWSLHSVASDPDTLMAAKTEADRMGEKLSVSFLKLYIASRKDQHKPDWAIFIHELDRSSVDCEQRMAWLKDNRPAVDLSEPLTKIRQRLINALHNIEELMA